MKKIAVLLTILSLTAVTGLSAQNYNWAIGVRGGVTASGITVLSVGVLFASASKLTVQTPFLIYIF